MQVLESRIESNDRGTNHKEKRNDILVPDEAMNAAGVGFCRYGGHIDHRQHALLVAKFSTAQDVSPSQ